MGYDYRHKDKAGKKKSAEYRLKKLSVGNNKTITRSASSDIDRFNDRLVLREYYIYQEALRICDKHAYKNYNLDKYYHIRKSLEKDMNKIRPSEITQETFPADDTKDAVSLYYSKLKGAPHRLDEVENLVKRENLRDISIHKILPVFKTTAEKVKALCPLLEDVLLYNSVYEPEHDDRSLEPQNKPRRKSQLSSLYSIIYNFNNLPR